MEPTDEIIEKISNICDEYFHLTDKLSETHDIQHIIAAIASFVTEIVLSSDNPKELADVIHNIMTKASDLDNSELN